MKQDNGQSQEAQMVRQESKFINQIESFARYMDAEYVTNSDQPRSLCIIAADCLDAKSGKHALAHILLGDNRVNRCALRSMMEENDRFSEQVHDLCDNDGEDRSVEDLDEEIGSKQKRMTLSKWICVGIAAWSAVIIAMFVVGIASWITTVSNLLLLAWCVILVGSEIRSLNRNIEKLKQQRKRAAGRQKIMSRMEQFTDFLRQMRAQIEEDAGDDDDDE